MDYGVEGSPGEGMMYEMDEYGQEMGEHMDDPYGQEGESPYGQEGENPYG